MGKKYPAIIQIWERAWAQVIPFIQESVRNFVSMG